jgi:hypothetical protein
MGNVNSDSNRNMTMLRNLSLAFSRRAFTDMLEFDDFSYLKWLHSKYNLYSGEVTYSKMLDKIYSSISRGYRCEYVYKNELIKMLLKKYGSKNTVFFSEFRVGKTIADMVMFNGESKAFEIKTEYDSPKRLGEQLSNYKNLFDKCYLVVPESLCDYYKSFVDDTVGIILLSSKKGRISLSENRHATQNESFNSRLMMSCLRTTEYKEIASSLGYDVGNVAGYDLYSYCSDVISRSNCKEVKSLFLREIKKRKNNTSQLTKYPMPIRQMMLSLNLPSLKAEKLIKKLNSNTI